VLIGTGGTDQNASLASLHSLMAVARAEAVAGSTGQSGMRVSIRGEPAVAATPAQLAHDDRHDRFRAPAVSTHIVEREARGPPRPAVEG